MNELMEKLRKYTGLSRSSVLSMFTRTRGSTKTLPKGHRAKRKRLQKIQKESRRRNRT